MQLIAVLRGCFTCYLFGVLVAWGSYLHTIWQDEKTVFNEWISLYISVVYGVLFAIPIAFFVVLLWMILAYFRITVSFLVAPATAASLLLMIAVFRTSNVYAISGSVFAGLIIRSVFWLGAFGLKKSVKLYLRS
ncbi:MAG: hypothetical protein AAGK28_14185 [Pseudomonadota bacterium]